VTHTSRAKYGPRHPDHPSKQPAKLTRAFYRQVLRQLCVLLTQRHHAGTASVFRNHAAPRGR